ncbi:farnesyl pyrophosphate synthetase [Sistotremastrum suecicum HHB10207 ss-3]|uniref:(2E,6E)-farnesyl diphosphate synthase n=1 Tax=Sistotremastrum suecicum HHB10207 ss-3 TaxID=1314776 RepID=A0A166I499_9AGAM|nr:farnesyl pyrophosphate synthetase [Sistotremastrum suecicum HHB10207 ss-3]
MAPTLAANASQNGTDTFNYANTPSVKASDLKAASRKKRFQDVFPVIRDELVAYFDECKMPEDAKAWFKRNIDYNTPHGKLNRGISVVDTVEILKGSSLDDQEYFRAALLGWCVEFLQAYFLVADDMMDASITRRGQPCWYRNPGVGNIAINDAFMLEACIYYLLKKHFRSEPYYVELLELFHDTTYQTEMGQLVDLITAPEDHVDLDKFSLEKHRFIVLYKTAFYSFYLPVALAMHMVGIKSQSAYDHALSILLPLGEYFQIQDDYLDCFGSAAQIGKIGTDILDNKCSWNINIALKKATPEQRQILNDNYGRKDSECERRVKDVFNQIDIPRLYKEYEDEAYEKICTLIDGIQESADSAEPTLRRAAFKAFLDKIYKRSK